MQNPHIALEEKSVITLHVNIKLDHIMFIPKLINKKNITSGFRLSCGRAGWQG